MGSETELRDLVTLVLGTSTMLIMVIAIISIGLLVQRKLIKKERAYRDIEKLLQKQELKSAYALIEGQEQERKRIASDIHDNVGNLMATLKIYSDLVVAKEQDVELQRLNRKINDITESVTQEIRKISHALDSGIVHNFGLKVALDQLTEAVQNSGKIQVISLFDIPNPINSDTSLNIYRVIQELVTNTLKHAQATKLRIEVSQLTEEISIIFEDNGIGFVVAKHPIQSKSS
jgi:signal transduction histidine kinase